MPTADATLLPPPFDASSPASERGSARRLDEVGVETVLGAMVAQRRASRPSMTLELEIEADAEATTTAPPAAEARGRAPAVSEVFLKAR